MACVGKGRRLDEITEKVSVVGKKRPRAGPWSPAT